MPLITGIARGRRSGKEYPYVHFRYSDEFIKYVRDNFNRECVIDTEKDVMLIYPQLNNPNIFIEVPRIKSGFGSYELVLVNINNSNFLNNIELMNFRNFHNQYEVTPECEELKTTETPKTTKNMNPTDLLGSVVTYNDNLAKIVGIIDRPAAIIELIESKKCEHCNCELSEPNQVVAVISSPMYKGSVKPVKTIEK